MAIVAVAAIVYLAWALKSAIEADAMLRKRPKEDVDAPIEVLLPLYWP